MIYHKVESCDALLLVRSMGLLLNQAAVYGPVHNVTKCATTRVYQEFVEQLERYWALEFTVQSNLICINGVSGDVDSAVSANLVRRFAQLDISGLLFVHPLPAKEFEKCIRILAMPIALVSEASGVAELFRRERLQAVQVVNIDYRRVDKNQAQSTPENPVSDLRAPISSPAVTVQSGVIDLSGDMEEAGELSFEMFGSAVAERKLEAERQARQQQSQALAALLRATAATLEQNTQADASKQLDRVMSAMEQLRAALALMTKGSETAIATLAQQVSEDKQTVAGIEADAMLRGYSLKLTREDLLTRYAELNQEILQPLTVSTGVIDALRKGYVGEVSESQQELLTMAHESIERVNQLVDYMNGISGLPVSFTPDMDLIHDSYAFGRVKSEG